MIRYCAIIFDSFLAGSVIPIDSGIVATTALYSLEFSRNCTLFLMFIGYSLAVVFNYILGRIGFVIVVSRANQLQLDRLLKQRKQIDCVGIAFILLFGVFETPYIAYFITLGGLLNVNAKFVIPALLLISITHTIHIALTASSWI